MIDQLHGQGSYHVPGPPRRSGRPTVRAAARTALHRLRRVDAAVWGVRVALLAIVFVWSLRADVRQIIDVVRNARRWWLLAVFAVAIALHLGFVVTQSLILRTLGHRIPFLPADTPSPASPSGADHE